MNFPVVFYDGDCGFCNRSVQFVLRHERRREIRFCTLQSEKARSFFNEKGRKEPDMSTFYFWDGDRLYERSSAGLRVASYLNAPYSFACVFWCVPRFLRDAVYNSIARRRHKISKGFCVLPSAEDRRRFLE